MAIPGAVQWISRLLVAVPLAGSALGGCTSDEPAYRNPGDGCIGDSRLRRPVALDDRADLGYSGADVIAMVNARAPALLTWQDGTTTQVTLHATGGTAQVDTAPPYQGYCQPALTVDDAQLRFTTEDGRLDLTIPTPLAGLGQDGTLDVVFPVDATSAFTRPTPLPIPEAWSSPDRPAESVGFRFHVGRAGIGSPYCLAGEAVASDPSEVCNGFDGTIVFVAHDPTAPVEAPGPEFHAAVGWWTWR